MSYHSIPAAREPPSSGVTFAEEERAEEGEECETQKKPL